MQTVTEHRPPEEWPIFMRTSYVSNPNLFRPYLPLPLTKRETISERSREIHLSLYNHRIVTIN